jgi:hypothetical protein
MGILLEGGFDGDIHPTYNNWKSTRHSCNIQDKEI